MINLEHRLTVDDLIVEYATKVDNGNIVSCRPGIDERCNSYYASLGI